MHQVDTERDLERSVGLRSAALYQEMQEGIFKRTDRMFAGLMVFQWLAGIIAALWLSPKTWSGPDSYTHPHVWAAIFIGGAIILAPVMLALFQPGKALTRHVIAVAEMLTSALLIYLTGGRIETHFHIFGALAFLAFYRDWRVLITASIVVALHHCLFGLYAPQSIYGVLAIQPWRWVEHAGWVVFKDVFLIIAIVQSLREMKEIAGRQANLETVNARIEQQVRERTAEFQQSESRLKESQTKLVKVFDATHDIIVINRLRDGGFVDANSAFERSGITRAQALATSAAIRRIPLSEDEWNKYAQAIQANGAVDNLEIEFHFEDGRLSPSLVSGVLIELNGEPCVVSIIRDITRLKETERALIVAREDALTASHAKSEFLSSMSHEIRTPMNAILGMTELLQETTLNQDQKKYLDVMANNGSSLLGLINDILDLARVESGRLTLEQTAFDLENLSDNVIEMLGVRAHAKGLEIAGI
jgi:PAS domain S-box-containing protein